SLLGIRMVNEQARQIKHSRHPGNDCYDMDGLGPGVEIVRSECKQQRRKSEKDNDGDRRTLHCPFAAFANLTVRHQRTASLTCLTMASTWAIGVSGGIPWPRLNTSGPPPSDSRMALTPSSKAHPPATSRSGSRLPCTAPSYWWVRTVSSGAVQSCPSAVKPVSRR